MTLGDGIQYSDSITGGGSSRYSTVLNHTDQRSGA